MNSPSKAYSLFKQIHASPGMKYLNRRKLRAFTFNIFMGNYTELKKAYELVENPKVGFDLMTKYRHTAGIQAHMEVMRLFHNFLASAKSLVDHTRAFVDEHYINSSFKQSYDQKIQADFAKDPLVKFVQDLRNYMLHRGLPNGSMTIQIKKIDGTNAQDLSTTVSINRDKLLEWSKWTQLSRTYLESSDEDLKISKIGNDYGQKVLAFYEWFDKRLEKHHEQDLIAFELLQKEYEIAEKQENTQRENT